MFTEIILIRLGSSQAGLLASLTAQLADEGGVVFGPVYTTDFVELGLGDYTWTHDFDDCFNGFVRFTAPGGIVVWSEIEPPGVGGGGGGGGSLSESEELITLERAKKEPTLRVYDDEYLEIKIAAASARMISECNRRFALLQRIETYDGPEDQQIILNAFPVSEIVAMEIADQSVSPPILYPQPLTDLVLEDEGRTGILEFSRVLVTGIYVAFPSGKQNIRVTYIGGYNPIPADLQEACVFMVKHLIAEGNKDTSVSSERLGSYSYVNKVAVDTAAAMPAFYNRTIARYKDWRV